PGSLINDLAQFMSAGTSNTTSFFISARTEIIDPASPQQAQGYGAYAQSLEILVDTQPPPIFFGLPNVPNDGLLPDSDTGDQANPETLVDLVTSDTTPGFFGQAEADSVVRLFVDLNANGTTNPDGTGDGIFEPDVDFQVGFDVAKPYDGTNQYPNGYWQVDAITFNLNAAPFPIGGQRTLFATAEDVAGNINPANGLPIQFNIFIDTQGPQVTNVTVNSTTDFLAVDDANNLLRFSSSNPNVIVDTIGTSVTGTLQAIDILPGPVGPAANVAGNSFPKGTLFGLATDG